MIGSRARRSASRASSREERSGTGTERVGCGKEGAGSREERAGSRSKCPSCGRIGASGYCGLADDRDAADHIDRAEGNSAEADSAGGG